MSSAAGMRDGVPPALVSDFMSDLREPRTTYISSDRFAKRLGVNKSALARIAGVNRNTMRTNPGSEAIQSTLREIVKVIVSANELTADLDKALYWFRNEPIRDYRGKTALELVTDGQTSAVLAYLEDLKNGAAG